MLFELTEGHLAPAHPPLAHSIFASRLGRRFAHARELRMLFEIRIRMRMTNGYGLQAKGCRESFRR